MFKFKNRGNKRRRPPIIARAKEIFSRKKKIFLGAIIAVLIVPASWYGHKMITTTPLLAIKKIDVSGAARVSNEEITELTGIHAGDNIVAMDAGEAASRVAKNPWVAKAQVVRVGFNTIRVIVVEKEPVALIKLDELYMMDASGAVFKKLTADDMVDLPVITGISEADKDRLTQPAMALVSVLKARKGFNIDKVSEIKYDRTFGFSVYTLDEGVRLDVGVEGYEEKLLAFERVLSERGGSLSGVEAMDLTGRRGVIVKFKTNMA